jgi:ankyrin repeat protein
LNRKLSTFAYFGQLDAIKEAVSKGADIHHDSNSAFKWAVVMGQLEVVKYLLEQGVDITVIQYDPVSIARANNKHETADYLQNYIRKLKLQQFL